MARAASRLSLIVVAALCLQPLGLAQDASPVDETALRAVAEELFAAYAREDLEGFMGQWSANSPELATRRKAMQELFAANERIEVKRLTVSRVKVEGDKASLRVSFEMNALDVKTGKPAEGFGRMNRALQFVKEEGRWKVWREAAAEEDLAAALVAAKTDEESGALLAAEQELMTVGLRKALIVQGDQLRRQGKYLQALSVYTTALSVGEQIADKTGMARALLLIGVVHYRQGNYDLSLDSLQKSLALSELLGDQAAVADALSDMAIVHYLQANYNSALEYYKKSLALSESLGMKGEIANSLNGIGIIHYRQGNYDLTLDYYRKALALREALGNKTGIAYSLNNLGGVYQVLGNYGLALGYYQRSLALREMMNDTPEIPVVLANIGSLHQLQGNYGLALEYYQKSLKMTETLGDKKGIAYALSMMGEVYRAQGNYIQALEYYKKSLRLEEAMGDKQKIAGSLNSIGQVYEAQGSYTQALEYYQKSLDLSKELGLKLEIARTLINIGAVYNLQGHYSMAVELLESATNIARQIGRRDTLWDARTTVGGAYRALNQPAQARQAFEEAIVTVESLRAQVAGGEQEQQRFFENKISPYHAMVELLVAQNKPDEALTYAERAKARVLLDVLQSGRSDIAKAMTAQEKEHERRLRSELVSFNSQVSREGVRAQPDQTRLADLKARLQKARLEYEAFQTSLYAAHLELRVQRGEAKTVTLEETAKLLPDAQSALLEYVVTDEKTYLFVLTAGSDTTRGTAKLQSHTLAIKRKDLTEHVAALRQQLAKRDLTFRPTASKLYDLLLSPARAELQGKQTLVIVPDGALWELPFQALLDAQGRYLIEDHALSYAPSLTVLREMAKLRRQRKGGSASSKTLLAMGNPALGNETVERVRLVHRDDRLNPLPEAEREVKTLGQLYGAAQSRVYVAGDAREDRLKAEAGRFGVLHLATHSILNDASPMYSQVVLAQSAEGASEDGLLEAWEIMNLDLNADVVVLSACETGRGRVGAGEGVIGLTWALFVAGSPTTVVSQWKVESASTTSLMLEFHRNRQDGIKKSHVSTAKALQGAAFKMLRTTEYRHPFYWAGFVVVGDGG